MFFFSGGYEVTFGTEYSGSATASMGVSLEVEETIQAGLEALFSTEIGISSTTSYDWSNAASGTFSVSETFTITTPVAPGQKVWN